MSYWSNSRPVRRNRALSPEAIACSTAELLNDQGFDNVSLRVLAEQLGVAPASLYSRIDSLADAYDLALDHALGADRKMQRVLAGGDVLDLLVQLYRHLIAHPWAIHVIAARPPRGPSYLKASETLVRRLQEAGVEDPLAMAYSVSNLVLGAALTQQAARREPAKPIDAQLAPHYSALHAVNELDSEAVLRQSLSLLLH